MGWSCMQGTRPQVVDSLVREWGDDRKGFFILRRKWDGWNRLWCLCETRRPPEGEEGDEATVVTRFIMLVMLRSHPSYGEWCVKEVTDDMGPCDVSAPLAWLDEVTMDRRDGYAYAWYQRVRAYHQRRGTGKKLQKFQPVKLLNGRSAVITDLSPLKANVEGFPCRIKRSQIDWVGSGLVPA